MSKPKKTVADYMVIAISPVLIMALVGSLCFFLIDVFYRGQMLGGVRWVMFWFIIGIVLVSRIAIEQGRDQAVAYGLGLALATLLFLVRTQPAPFIGGALLIIVWFSAHKLVWDCTLIDEFQDSSGQGLLQKPSQRAGAPLAEKPGGHSPSPPPEKRGGVKRLSTQKPVKKTSEPHSPGKWVVYFSLAALPLFGIGQKLLPTGGVVDPRTGFILLICYLTAALGLLVTTSFLGLRRYLRQRYLAMPPSIALAWLKFGVGVALLVLIGAIFLPRPGANEAWAGLRYQIDYQLHRASQFANAANAPGQGQGRPGDEKGGQNGEAKDSDQNQDSQQNGQQSTGNQIAKNGQNPSPSPAPEERVGERRPNAMTPSPDSANYVFQFMRGALWLAAILVIGGWLIRNRNMLLEMLRSLIAALREFFNKLLDLTPTAKLRKRTEPEYARPKLSSFAEYRNPFFTTEEYAWPPEQIIIYTYEAVQVWSREQGVAPRPEETSREFCTRLGEARPDLEAQLEHLSRLYAHAAFGTGLPPQTNLEPIKDLWRQMAVPGAVTA